MADERRVSGGSAAGASRARPRQRPARRGVLPRGDGARARQRACFGEGDVEGAVAEWTASIALSGSHARCAPNQSAGRWRTSALARASEWADVRARAWRTRGPRNARDPARIKGHVRHAAAREPRSAEFRARVARLLVGAAHTQKLNKEEALELKRHKSLAARRRTAYDKAVAELCATTSTSARSKRWRRSRPRAAVVQRGEGSRRCQRSCCAILGRASTGASRRGPSTRSTTRKVDACLKSLRGCLRRRPPDVGRGRPRAARLLPRPLPTRTDYPRLRHRRDHFGHSQVGQPRGLGLPRGRAR